MSSVLLDLSEKVVYPSYTHVMSYRAGTMYLVKSDECVLEPLAILPKQVNYLADRGQLKSERLAQCW
jgi:hypothetical protein